MTRKISDRVGKGLPGPTGRGFEIVIVDRSGCLIVVTFCVEGGEVFVGAFWGLRKALSFWGEIKGEDIWD